MAYRFLRLFALLAILGLVAAGAASAQDCSGIITADEAIDCIEKNQCTVTGGATPFLRQLLDTAAARPAAMASLRRAS